MARIAGRGRRSWTVDRRKAFALRLYGAIRRRCVESGAGNRSPFEWFARRLRETKAPVKESTVRGWLPPRQQLDRDPTQGSFVRRRDWDELRTPDLAQLCEVANLLDVSMDYLVGRPVPMRSSDREPTGELAKALRDFVLSSCSKLPYWDQNDLSEAALALPEGGALLDLTSDLLSEYLVPRVTLTRAARMRTLLHFAIQPTIYSDPADPTILRSRVEGLTPESIAEITRLASPPEAGSKGRLRTGQALHTSRTKHRAIRTS